MDSLLQSRIEWPMLTSSKRTFRQLVFLKIIKHYSLPGLGDIGLIYNKATGHGLRSDEVNSSLQTLQRSGLVEKLVHGFRITNAGEKELEFCVNILNSNLTGL